VVLYSSSDCGSYSTWQTQIPRATPQAGVEPCATRRQVCCLCSSRTELAGPSQPQIPSAQHARRIPRSLLNPPSADYLFCIMRAFEATAAPGSASGVVATPLCSAAAAARFALARVVRATCSVAASLLEACHCSSLQAGVTQGTRRSRCGVSPACVRSTYATRCQPVRKHVVLLAATAEWTSLRKKCKDIQLFACCHSAAARSLRHRHVASMRLPG
jgi:hypothetical protein